MNTKLKIPALFLAVSTITASGFAHAFDAGRFQDIRRNIIQTAPIKGTPETPFEREERLHKKTFQEVSSCKKSDLEISMAKNRSVKEPFNTGVIFTVKNKGKTDCSVEGYSTISFSGMKEKVQIARRIPRGFFPGPVILPHVIEHGKKAHMSMHWRSKDSEGRCVSPHRIHMNASNIDWYSKIETTVCGAKKGPLTFEQSTFGD